nr:ribosomal protein L13 [Cryptomonas sp. NIES-345]BDA98462.1 ribosomal protein L13 [Cryptomonas sp. NIES-1327]
MNKTKFFNGTNQNYQWFIFNANSERLGRLSTTIARVLLGKNNVHYTPGQRILQGVIVINAKEVQVSGKKETDKLYYKHSGRPGGLKIETFKSMKNKDACKIIEQSVKRMLPKNSLGRELFRKLKVYHGIDHPHLAQNPSPLKQSID